MNQKKVKALRKIIGDWREKWYDVIEHPLNPAKILTSPHKSLGRKFTIKLNPQCGRAQYQEMKKNGR